MTRKKKTNFIAQCAIILLAGPCAAAGPTLGYEFVGQVLNARNPILAVWISEFGSGAGYRFHGRRDF
jgi:hypothetical protein